MGNISVYLNDEEEDWLREYYEDNRSEFFHTCIKEDQERVKKEQIVKKVEKRLELLQLCSFLFLGISLVLVASLVYYGQSLQITTTILAISGLFAIIYAVLGYKKNGSKK